MNREDITAVADGRERDIIVASVQTKGERAWEEGETLRPRYVPAKEQIMTKKLLCGALVAVLGAATLFAQGGMQGGKNAAAEQEIQKLETGLWQAWKDHNTGPFEEHLTIDSIDISGPPLHGKANILKEMGSANCQISSFSVSGFSYTWLSRNSLIVTYEASQDGSCGGNKLPGKVYASSVWVKRGGKWMTAFHQESPSM